MTPLARKWLFSGRAVSLPRYMSTEFDRFVNSLPWFTSTLDWSRMPKSVELDVSGEDEPAYGKWLSQTRLGTHSHLAVHYPRQEGLIVPMHEGIAKLDALCWPPPGPHFLFGVDVSDSEIRPSYHDFMEYNHNQVFTAVAL